MKAKEEGFDESKVSLPVHDECGQIKIPVVIAVG